MDRVAHHLVEAFGRDRVLVELWDHGDPLDRHRNDALAEAAIRAGVDVVATNNVHYATPQQRPLATALAAIRSRRSLDEIDGWLPRRRSRTWSQPSRAAVDRGLAVARAVESRVRAPPICGLGRAELPTDGPRPHRDERLRVTSAARRYPSPIEWEAMQRSPRADASSSQFGTSVLVRHRRVLP
jgi:hypothetical protein